MLLKITRADSLSELPQLNNPAHFQRSPYNVDAPYNLNTKSGLLLYENAQEPLKVLINGKAANIQAFLTSLLIDVEKFHLENAVMVTVAGVRVNLITDYGLVTKDAATKLQSSLTTLPRR